jgi:protein-S-isoprenylcysteine O-methyltransferase Ste14
MIGVILLGGSTFGIVFTSGDLIRTSVLNMVIFGSLAVVCFCLLIYTLFFALPFQDTYLETGGSPKIYKDGMYALCRHPGVLWFIGFYIFLGLMLKIPLLIAAAVVFSLLNLLYVVFQDNWTFMKMFSDYDLYKKETPFLLPNLDSIKRCIKTI